MMLSRRALFAAGAIICVGAGSSVEACSLVARQRPKTFSDTACRRSLADLIRLINDGPRLSDEALATRVEELSVNLIGRH